MPDSAAIIHGYVSVCANLDSDTKKKLAAKAELICRGSYVVICAEREVKGVEEDFCRRSSLRPGTHTRAAISRKLRTDGEFCPRKPV